MYIANFVKSKAPQLDGIIYMDCDVETTMQRIKLRNRQGEANIPISYQKALHTEYEKWLNIQIYNNEIPVLKLIAHDLKTKEYQSNILKFSNFLKHMNEYH